MIDDSLLTESVVKPHPVFLDRDPSYNNGERVRFLGKKSLLEVRDDLERCMEPRGSRGHAVLCDLFWRGVGGEGNTRLQQ